LPELDHPERSAGFVVLTAPDIPSVLVKPGCLSNPQEEAPVAAVVVAI
jgi:N-acetylmuramoyl-L-alanine amidase